MYMIYDVFVFHKWFRTETSSTDKTLVIGYSIQTLADKSNSDTQMQPFNPYIHLYINLKGIS